MIGLVLCHCVAQSPCHLVSLSSCTLSPCISVTMYPVSLILCHPVILPLFSVTGPAATYLKTVEIFADTEPNSQIGPIATQLLEQFLLSQITNSADKLHHKALYRAGEQNSQ